MFVSTVNLVRRISSHRANIARLYSPTTPLSMRHAAFSTHNGVLARRLIPIHKYAGEVKPNSYIVELKPGTDKAAHLAALQPHLVDSHITHDYDDTDDPDDFIGYGGIFSKNTLNYLRASPDVESIEEDGIVNIMATTTQTNTP